MQRTKNLFVRLLCLFLAINISGLPQAFAHTNTTTIGRLPLVWPDLGHEGGALLQSRIVTGITQLADNTLGRWTGDVTLADNASTTVTHNLDLALSKLKVLIFEAGTQLTNAQVAAGYVVSQVNTDSYTVQNVTGSSKTIQVITLAFKGGIDAADLDPALAVNTTGNISATKLGAKAEDIELNDDATATGADYKATIRRPTSGMTGNTVITVPSVTTTLVGNDTVDALSNKTITDSNFVGGTASTVGAGLNRRLSLPSNTLTDLQAITRVAGLLYYATDTQKVYYDNGTSLLAVGSGSGSGGINYIINPDFETDASGVVAYKDAAATTAVDGTGGSPTLSFSRSGTVPLRGLYSGLITKTAANLQGEGVAIDFTVDYADLGKAITFKFDTEASANYTGPSGNEYIVVQVYDVTNSTLVTTTTVNAFSSGKSEVNGWFLSSTSGSVYRLILHVAGTGTAAWTAKIDNLRAFVNSLPTGPSMQDATLVQNPAMYYEAGSGVPTFSANEYTYSVSGDTVIIEGTFNLSSKASRIGWFGMKLPLLPKSTGFQGEWYNASGSTITYSPTITQTVLGVTYTRFRLTGTTNGDLRIENTTTGVSYGYKLIYKTSETSANTQLAARALEVYAADDGTSDVFGPNGALVPNVGFTTGLTSRDFVFQTAQDPTNSVVIEFNEEGNTGWLPATDIYPFSRGNNASSSNYYGISGVWISTTTFRVNFGNQGITVSTSSASNGSASWSSRFSAGDRWRVRKVASGASVGFPIGSRNIVADTSGTAIPQGMLGSVVESAITTTTNVTASANIYQNLTTLTLTPGTWHISAALATSSAGTTFLSTGLAISQFSGNTITDHLTPINSVGILCNTSNTATAVIPKYVVNVGVTTTYYIKGVFNYTGTVPVYRVYAIAEKK